MIETKRLILRPWRESDAEILYAYAKELTREEWLKRKEVYENHA